MCVYIYIYIYIHTCIIEILVNYRKLKFFERGVREGRRAVCWCGRKIRAEGRDKARNKVSSKIGVSPTRRRIMHTGKGTRETDGAPGSNKCLRRKRK